MFDTRKFNALMARHPISGEKSSQRVVAMLTSLLVVARAVGSLGG